MWLQHIPQMLRQERRVSQDILSLRNYWLKYKKIGNGRIIELSILVFYYEIVVFRKLQFLPLKNVNPLLKEILYIF